MAYVNYSYKNEYYSTQAFHKIIREHGFPDSKGWRFFLSLSNQKFIQDGIEHFEDLPCESEIGDKKHPLDFFKDNGLNFQIAFNGMNKHHNNWIITFKKNDEVLYSMPYRQGAAYRFFTSMGKFLSLPTPLDILTVVYLDAWFFETTSLEEFIQDYGGTEKLYRIAQETHKYFFEYFKDFSDPSEFPYYIEE